MSEGNALDVAGANAVEPMQDDEVEVKQGASDEGRPPVPVIDEPPEDDD